MSELAIKRWAGVVINVLFPPRCTFCGVDVVDLDGNKSSPSSNDPLLCEQCLSATLPTVNFCRRCAMPIREADQAEDCNNCRHQRFHFESAVALNVYEGRMREIVLCTKKVVYEPLTAALGILLARRFRDQFLLPDLIVPVPMHWTRRMLRGGNSAEILAGSMVAQLRLPAALDLLACRRKTNKQGTLLPNERVRNMRGAFTVSRTYDIRDAHILLVDDVMTTSATANEAAKLLRQHGAAKVSVAVIARGVGIQ